MKKRQKPTKTHKFASNAYINKDGDYRRKPFFANFWKEGFLDDVPTRRDYNRVMDGIVYSGSVIRREDYATDKDYWRALREEDQDHLYGLERLQMSLVRLWNGAPREWIKLIVRILIIALYVALVYGVGKLCGVY